MTNLEYGKIAFEAYKQSKQGTTYDAKPIPNWEDLGEAVQAAWIAGAVAVLKAFSSEMTSKVLRERDA